MTHQPTSLSPATDRLSWGVVTLRVTDLPRAVAFWTSALGLVEREHKGEGVALGTRIKTLIILQGGARTAAARPYCGMYHVAIGVGSQLEFSRILARLIRRNVPVAPTDHLMAKSIYLHDPDGLEIEVTYETPERFGRYGDMSRGLELFDSDGKPHGGRDPLDVAAELSHAEGADTALPLANDSYLAHLHFKVPAIEPALDWFTTLGFERHLTLDSWGFADMGAGRRNTHRLAMNIWAGPNTPPTPADMAGLSAYELVVHDMAALTLPDLTRDGDAMRTTDPMGVPVTLHPATD